MWAAAVIIVLALVSAFLLWVPLDLVFGAEIYGKPRLRLRFRWLFGLVRGNMSGARAPEEKSPEAGPRKKRRRGGGRLILNILHTRGLTRQLKELFGDVFGCLQFRDVAADFTIGAGDPANTGLLFSIIGPASVFLGGSSAFSLTPSFGDEVFLRGCSRGTLRVRPIRLLPPLLRFVFSLTTLRIVRALIASRGRGR